MKKIKLYRIISKEKSEVSDFYILDFYMDDSLRSHRYYFMNLAENSFGMNRVKSIDFLLQVLESLGLGIIEISDEKQAVMYSVIYNILTNKFSINKSGNNMDEINKEIKKDNPIQKQNIFNFSEIMDFDKIMMEKYLKPNTESSTDSKGKVV